MTFKSDLDPLGSAEYIASLAGIAKIDLNNGYLVSPISLFEAISRQALMSRDQLVDQVKARNGDKKQ